MKLIILYFNSLTIAQPQMKEIRILKEKKLISIDDFFERNSLLSLHFY